MAAFNLKSRKALTAAIQSIRGNKLKAAVHEAAVHIVGHIYAHGDTTLAKDLIEAAHEARLDTKALMAWFLEFAPVRAQYEGEEGDRFFTGFKILRAKRDNSEFDGERLMNGPTWYEWCKPTVAKATEEFDVLEKVRKLIKKAQKLAAEDAGRVKNRELLDVLHAVLAKAETSAAKAEPAAVPHVDGEPTTEPQGSGEFRKVG
jgi:hypothetical protein